MNQSSGFQHHLESPLPVEAPEGVLHLKGWCSHPSSGRIPQLRLSYAGRESSLLQRLPRPDVCHGLAAPDSSSNCGFEFYVSIPNGVQLARLEASLDGIKWFCLRGFPITAATGTLRAVIEHPNTATISESVRVHGWCAHPDRHIAEVWLHYGNHRIRCDYGLRHADVATLLPTSPNATGAGFRSVNNLPVGCGPLRVCGIDTAGRRHFFHTDLWIDIRTNDKNTSPVDLSGPPARLGPVRQPTHTAPPPQVAATPRRILFVLYHDMTSNSALHVAALANELCGHGHECVVAVPRNAETVRYHPGARFRCIDFAACDSQGAVFAGGAGPDLIHAWTPRENVRRFCTRLVAHGRPPLVVHLEDNEARILESTLGLSALKLAELSPATLDTLVGEAFSHPLRSAEFLHSAAAYTVIVDRLLTLLPSGKPARVIWPAASAAFFERPIPWELRAALGWDRTHTVLFYHGNLHPTNCDEMAALYEAVVQLNATGTPTTLVRAGRDFCPLPGDLAERAAPHIVTLGRIGRNDHLAPLLALADFFVQPGESDTFNDYRVPSKLPEFFAIGRPVILPRTNLGAITRHRVDAYVVDRADADGIAQAVRALRADPALATTLSSGAATYSREHFNWARSAVQLEEFYETLLAPAQPRHATPASPAVAMGTKVDR